MPTAAEKLAALRSARSLLEPGGHLVFDVFSPTRDDIEETHGRWLEREPGIFERADWDQASRTMTLSVRRDDTAATFTLHWLSAPEWHELIEDAGFEVEALYGWFDRRPFDEHADTIGSAADAADQTSAAGPRDRTRRRSLARKERYDRRHRLGERRCPAKPNELSDVTASSTRWRGSSTPRRSIRPGS